MNIAIIVAGGSGTRMGTEKNKVFLKLSDRTIMWHTLKAFNGCKKIDKIVIVARKADIEQMHTECIGFSKVSGIIEGGKERQDSVYNGIKHVITFGYRDKEGNENIAVVHNGCNPFIMNDEIQKCIEAAKNYGAGVCAFPVKDTIKYVKSFFVEETLDRSRLWCMQTPQAMRVSIAIKAFEKAYADGYYATDDVSLVERLGEKVKVIKCSYKNFKITTQEDLEMAQGIFQNKTNNMDNIVIQENNSELIKQSDIKKNFIIVGIGEDSHRFGDASKKLVVGGVEIESEGVISHSDGDVLLHALFNAISSAAGGRSIGYYFPDSDLINKDRKSSEFFKKIFEMLDDKKLKVNNVSISIEAKRPKFENYCDAIKKNIAELLKVSSGCVGITFTSGEDLTAFGRGEGIRATCYVSLK